VTFILDAQLPPAFGRALIQAGYSAKLLQEIGLKEAEDDVIWNYAAENHLIIVTKDEDFADHVLRSAHGPSVVWLRIGNCTNSYLIGHVLPLFSEILLRLESGDRLIEVL
jgi:predicted nuclease of predicted toxin-antitoxin system